MFYLLGIMISWQFLIKWSKSDLERHLKALVRTIMIKENDQLAFVFADIRNYQHFKKSHFKVSINFIQVLHFNNGPFYVNLSNFCLTFQTGRQVFNSEELKQSSAVFLSLISRPKSHKFVHKTFVCLQRQNSIVLVPVIYKITCC